MSAYKVGCLAISKLEVYVRHAARRAAQYAAAAFRGRRADVAASSHCDGRSNIRNAQTPSVSFWIRSRVAQRGKR
jgi:hypothetical protein